MSDSVHDLNWRRTLRSVLGGGTIAPEAPLLIQFAMQRDFLIHVRIHSS